MGSIIQLFVRDRSFYKRVAAISIPIVFQSVITLGVSLIDTLMLSSLGEVQISASSMANQVTHLFQIFCNGIGFGAAVLLAQYWGRQQLTQMRQVVTIMLRLILLVGTVVTLATLLFPAWMMRVFVPGEPEVIQAGVAYFTYLAYTYIFFGLSLTITIAMRSVGEVYVPLISSCICFFINVFFNWLFIFGKLGAPRMEIAGAAVGTLLARIFEFLFICGFFFFREQKIAYRLRHFRQVQPNILREFREFGAPVVVSDTLLGLGYTAVSMVVGRMGKVFSAANAITVVLYRIVNIAIQGVGNAGSVITGNTLGTGDREKTYQQGVTLLMIGGLMGLAASIIMLLISPSFTAFFQVEPVTHQVAIDQLKAMVVLVPFQAITFLTTKGVLRGGGDTRFLVFVDVVLLWGTSVPLGYLGGLHWGLNAFWTFMLLHTDYVVKAVVCIHRFFSKKWMKTVT